MDDNESWHYDFCKLLIYYFINKYWKFVEEGQQVVIWIHFIDMYWVYEIFL